MNDASIAWIRRVDNNDFVLRAPNDFDVGLCGGYNG